MGSGRAAWLVLTGDAIDARRALEWGLVEEIGDGANVIDRLRANDPKAMRLQKQLLQLWDEAPLSTSVSASLGIFGLAYRK